MAYEYDNKRFHDHHKKGFDYGYNFGYPYEYNGYGEEYSPYDESQTIEEFIDNVQMELTISCSLPKNLPNETIRLIIEKRALPYFWQNYHEATQEMYYFIDKRAFFTEEFTKYKYIQMPCEIQAVTYLYEVRNLSLFSLGINNPNLSVSLGVTNQPYLSSYVTTIGELGRYKTIIDSMSDMLNQLNKYTLKYSFNYPNHRLHILTQMKYDLVAECYVNVPMENLFQDPLFYKYVIGHAKVALGNMYGRYNFNLQGQIQLQYADLISQGQAEIKEVEEFIANTSTSFFWMVKR